MKNFILLLTVILTVSACKDKPHEKTPQTTSDTVSLEARESAVAPDSTMISGVYKSCGSVTFSGNNKIANIYTTLPIIPNTKYTYVKFYNISSTSRYGLLGVLTTNNIHTDLRLRAEPAEFQKPDGNTVDLSKLTAYRGGLDFSKFKSTHDLYFVCFHDSRFNDNINDVLSYYQDNLPDIEDIPPPPLNKMRSDQPKVGNGGILSATACPEE